ncbi:uncharacterized protein LOC120342056 [Styela clava]
METQKGGNGRGSINPNYLHGNAVTSMISPINKQGYLGDLEEKSEPELNELLERQEKMLKNKKFVERLPDKGEKIQNFVKTLKELLEKREKEREEGKVTESFNHHVEDDPNMPGLEEIPTDDRSSRMELGEDTQLPHEKELKIIERGFDQLSVHEGPHYQVIVKAEEKSHKSKFALNRPNKKKSDSTNNRIDKPVFHSKDLTSASVHDPEHGEATLISVKECRDLYSEQQRIVQEQRAEQLAERVMRRMHISARPNEHPEGKYRTKDERTEAENTFDPEYLDSVD